MLKCSFFTASLGFIVLLSCNSKNPETAPAFYPPKVVAFNSVSQGEYNPKTKGVSYGLLDNDAWVWIDFNEKTRVMKVDVKTKYAKAIYDIVLDKFTRLPYNNESIAYAMEYKGYCSTLDSRVLLEYFYDKNDMIKYVTFTSTLRNSQILMFEDIDNAERRANRGETDKIVGSWFVPHAAFIKADFNADNTFRYNAFLSTPQSFEQKEAIVTGTYKFDGKHIILSRNDGTQEEWQYYIEKMDGFGRLKRNTDNGYTVYMKADDVN